MASTVTLLKVFISSPNELEAERKIIVPAIEEINPLLKDTKGVMLETIDWNRDIIPGVAEYSQAVINEQVDGRYDIYLGMLGSRFGTPTALAGSGTEEEFDGAYHAFKKAPETLKILFYFRTTSENIFATTTPEQLEKVFEFRRKLKDSGVLFHDFSDKDFLLQIVKTHLNKLVSNQWIDGKWRTASAKVEEKAGELIRTAVELPTAEDLNIKEAVEALGESEADDGFLDLMINGNAAIARALQTMTEIGSSIEEFGTETNICTEAVSNYHKHQNPIALRESVDSYSEFILSFARDMKIRSGTLRSNTLEFLSTVESMIHLVDQGIGQRSQMVGLQPAVTNMVTTMRFSREMTDKFRTSVISLPPVAKNLNRAKNRAADALADLSASITVLLERTENVLELIAKKSTDLPQ